MWIHVVIFVMILCALTGWKKGWIPSSGIGGKDGIRLFAVVAIAGNLLGMILTLQNGGQVYPQGYRLEKEDTGSYEKEFMVSVDGEEPVSMYIQVPEKELEEQEEEPKQNKKLTRKEQAQKSIAEAVSRYNEQRSDPDYYYLPDKLNGKKVKWESPADTSGMLLTGLFLIAAMAILVMKGREEQVQHDVQRARKGQIDQGLFGVADGAEHRIAEIVQCQRRHAQKIHPQVQDGTGQQVVLGVEQPQHEGRTQQADEQQRHTGDQADDGGRVHRLLHIGGVPGPVKACHQHVDAVAQADKETGEQSDQNAGGAHGTQRRGPGEPAHDGHVRHVEQYLQQVGQGQRQADQQNLLGQRAFRQGFGG